MTEEEWLGSSHPGLMRGFLRRRAAGDRKKRLFACACCRASREVFPDAGYRLVAEVGERYADGLADESECELAREEALRIIEECVADQDFEKAALSRVVRLSVQRTMATWVSEAVAFVPRKGGRAGQYDRLRSLECALLRCLFGNPFRPVSPGPWITPAAACVARDIYDRRDFSALPVLADLLEEAGCPEQSVLDHCRQPGEHARGCWVVDLVPGKE
jgi:hypothetical protein